MNQRASVTVALVLTLAGLFLCSSCGPSEPAPPASAPSDRSAAPVADAPPVPRARADAAADVPPAATRVVTVRVLTRKGDAPISGAHVTVGTGGDEAPGPSASADTDAEGRARVALPADVSGPFDITVRAAGHTPDHQQIEDAAPDEIVSYLDPAGRVQGIVRGTDGKPVANRSVIVDIDDADVVDVDHATTNDAGRFEVDGVPLHKTFTLVAWRDAEHGDRRLAMRRGLTVESADRPVEIALTIDEPALLTVRVQWSDGLPVQGAVVSRDPGYVEGESADGTADENGTVKYQPLPAESARITVRCWGFTDTRTEIELKAGEDRTVVVRPQPGPTLAGIVVDEDGRPVAEARVTPDAENAPALLTTAEGTFRLACPDETPLALDVEAPEFLSTNVADIAPPSDGLRIVLHRLAKVRCRLLWPAGVARKSRISAWVDGRAAEADLDGDVLRIVVPPSAKKVSFAVPGCIEVKRDLDATRGVLDDWGDVQLIAAARLTGCVIDEGGKPVKAFVYACVGDVRPPLESTDDDGAFSVDGLPPGEAEVRVEAEGFVTRTVRHGLAAGAAPLTVTLSRGGGVRGVVLDTDGNAAPSGTYLSFVDVKDPQNKDRQAHPRVGDDGRFDVRLAPGRYRARTALRDVEAEAEVDVAEGKTSEITLKLAAR